MFILGCVVPQNQLWSNCNSCLILRACNYILIFSEYNET